MNDTFMNFIADCINHNEYSKAESYVYGLLINGVITEFDYNNAIEHIKECKINVIIKQDNLNSK